MTQILRAHAEQQYAEELDELIKADTRPRPPEWRLSPWAVATYVLGGTLDMALRYRPSILATAASSKLPLPP